MEGIQLRRPHGAASPVIEEDTPLLLNAASTENIFAYDDKKVPCCSIIVSREHADLATISRLFI